MPNYVVHKYYPNTKLIKSDTFYNELNKIHNLYGSAIIEYYKSGNVKKETWMRDGKIYKEFDEPAVIEYFDSKLKNIKQYTYFQDQMIQRIYGPAIIIFDIKGKQIAEFYYIGNMQYSKEKFLEITKKVQGHITNG